MAALDPHAEDLLHQLDAWAATHLSEAGYVEAVQALDQYRGVVEDDEGD